MRNRTGPQRPRNADENAMSKHVRQASGIALAGTSKVVVGHTVKNGVQRPVLTEVTTTAVNRTSKVRRRYLPVFCDTASPFHVRHLYRLWTYREHELAICARRPNDVQQTPSATSGWLRAGACRVGATV